MPSISYETLRQTAISHLKAYETPVPFNNDSIQRYRTPDCVFYGHPTESLPKPFDGPIRQPEFIKAMELFGPVCSRLSFEIEDMTIDVEHRIVTLITKAVFDFRAFQEEPAEENYTVEYMMLNEMNDSGKKIIRVEEFMDV